MAIPKFYPPQILPQGQTPTRCLAFALPPRHAPENMTRMITPEKAASDAELARKAAKLWPHREHESNILLSRFCRAGLHRWRRLNLATLHPGKDILHCFWCAKVKIDGQIYDATNH